MKNILFLLLASLSTTGLFGQLNNMVVFSEEGERFYLILNGERMNNEPVTNLKVTDLNQPSYKAKIIFERTDLGEMDKNLYFQDSGTESVFMIAQNKKGEYKLRFRSATPIDQAPIAPPTQTVIVYGAPAPMPVIAPAPVMTGGAVVVEETTTTTTVGGGGTMGGTTESVNMNVGINGVGMNVGVTVSDGTSGSMSSTTTTTTTTTTSSGSMGVNSGVVVVEQPVIVEQPMVVETAVPCPVMSQGEFADACSSIESKTFADSKMRIAKQIIEGHCVTSRQVKGMLDLFTFEDDKLDLAKFAYRYVVDPQKYFVVNDAFTFESTIEDLDDYINSQR